MDANGNWWMPETILLRLIDESKLPLKETLHNVWLMFNSYVARMLTLTKKD